MINDTISYWHKTSGAKRYPPLSKNIDAGTLIIGGGITGITCAYALSGSHEDVTLIEADDICGGTTGNSTAKITVQHGLIYKRLMAEQGIKTARKYAEANMAAIDFINETARKENIECGLRGDTACVFAREEKEKALLKEEYEAAGELGIRAQYKENPGFPKESVAALCYGGQAVFNPVMYVTALSEAAQKRGAAIYCGTKAISVRDGEKIEVKCENGCVIKADYLVMATQYPIYDGPFGFYFTRLYPKRSYAAAFETEGKKWPDGSYISAGEPKRSVRTYYNGDRRILIIAGDGHTTARSDEDEEEHFKNLSEYAEKITGKKCGMAAKWSAQDYDTPDGIPYIGRLNADSHIYIASGYKKWGMTSGTLAGTMLSDIICRGGSEYEDVFSPARNDISSSLGNFLGKTAGWIGEFIKSKTQTAKQISGMHPGEGRMIEFEGKKAGIYLDDDGYVTITDIKCTHLKTTLNFNSAEKTWDCPAHGGRFAVDGRLIEGPPKDPLKVLFKGRYDEIMPEKGE